MSSGESLIELITGKVIGDDAKLAVYQGKEKMPFPVKRRYYIYDAVPEKERGFHAHRKTDQILTCLAGSVRIVLDDGITREEIKMVRDPAISLRLKPWIWHEILDLSSSTLLEVLASRIFRESDYIRNYDEFLREVGLRGVNGQLLQSSSNL